VTRHPVLSELSHRPDKYGMGRHTVPFFSNSAILFRSYTKIVRYTSIMYVRHVFEIRMLNTSNSYTDHYLSANLNSAEKEYLEPPALLHNVNN
jgi:hypothetical protein